VSQAEIGLFLSSFFANVSKRPQNRDIPVLRRDLSWHLVAIAIFIDSDSGSVTPTFFYNLAAVHRDFDLSVVIGGEKGAAVSDQLFTSTFVLGAVNVIVGRAGRHFKPPLSRVKVMRIKNKAEHCNHERNKRSLRR